MKINFLLPHLKLSGGVYVVMTFADELSKRGHTVIVAAESREVTRYVRNLFTSHPFLPRGSKVRILRVKDFSDLPDADVFVADSWKVAAKLYALNTRGVKFQHIQHDERMYHGDPAAVEKVFRLPLKRLVNATWLYDIFKKEFNQETTIIFNAIDCDLFNPDKRNRRADDTDVRILLLHHNYGWKGTNEGVDIVRNIQKKYPYVKLILYGTRTKNIDVPHDEYHYNAIGDELARLFANSDIYLGCSIDDSRPIAHRWAMASGAALAMYDNVSAGDYAFDGKTALIARKNDVDDLSRMVEKLIVDVKLRKHIADNALSFVRALPTWEALTDKLENVFIKEDSLHNK